MLSVGISNVQFAANAHRSDGNAEFSMLAGFGGDDNGNVKIDRKHRKVVEADSRRTQNVRGASAKLRSLHMGSNPCALDSDGFSGFDNPLNNLVKGSNDEVFEINDIFHSANIRLSSIQSTSTLAASRALRGSGTNGTRVHLTDSFGSTGLATETGTVIFS